MKQGVLGSQGQSCGKKDHPVKTHKDLLFRACYSKGVGHHHLRLAECFMVETGLAAGGPWLEAEAGEGLTRSGASCVTGEGYVSGFLWLVLSWK